MMSEPTKVDGLTTDELTGKLVLLIEEKRPWQETNLMHRQLATKVKNYVRHIRSPQFNEKHGKGPKDTIVRLVTVERPGKATVQLLERIGYELQKFDIEFEYEVVSESILGPTPVKPSTPPKPAAPKPQAPKPQPPKPGGQQPSARPTPPPAPGPKPAAGPPPAGSPQPPQGPGQPPTTEPPSQRPAAQRPEPPTPATSQPPGEPEPGPPVEPSGAGEPSESSASDPFLEYLQAEQDREASGTQAGPEPRPRSKERPTADVSPAAGAPGAEEADDSKKPEIFPEEEFGRLIELAGDDDQLVVESSSGKRTSLGRAGDTEAEGTPAFTTYAEQVAMEKPSIWRALLAGLTGAISGSLLWALMAAGVGNGVSPVAIAVGFMVGWSIRVRARGHTITYRIVAIIFTIFGTLLGTGLAAATVSALNEGAGFSGIIATLSSQSALLAAVGQVYDWLDLLAYAIAIYLAFRISATSAAPEEPGAL